MTTDEKPAKGTQCFDDLLAALEIMAGLVQLKYASRGDVIWAGEIAKAEEAIAKARGA